ncbi:HDIG domain-containing protein, partial [Candidatus Peregrinibacteria bacterium]|nr:HDIG domain-containing protein [Candidatus Peregrinibacteria bacterium]
YIPVLSKLTGDDPGAIKQKMLEELDEDLYLAKETRLSKYVDNLKEEAPLKARDLMTLSIQRYEAPSSVEKRNYLIPVRKSETKAKLIGKNAENIRFIEEATGVNVIFDEEKKGVMVTHYQLVKRQIAHEAILKLMRDSVINLDKVKIRLAEAERDVEQRLIKIGRNVLQELDLDYRKFTDGFAEMIGRMDFRTSYGQNILKHSYEVGYFSLMLGSELGLNQEICKIGGFLGDVGKAIDQEEGRPHDVLTKEIMEKHDFNWEEVHASWTHHDSIPIETAEGLIVKGADAMSAGRPGARQETIEKYQERIRAIEGIAKEYQGVKKSYAISGGRELRVFVDPKTLSDGDLKTMAEDVAENIEANVAYPGQIKVNLIRRTEHKKTLKKEQTK